MPLTRASRSLPAAAVGLVPGTRSVPHVLDRLGPTAPALRPVCR